MDNETKAEAAKAMLRVTIIVILMKLYRDGIGDYNRYVGHAYSNILRTLQPRYEAPKTAEYWHMPIGVGDDGEFMFADTEDEFNAVYTGNPYEPILSEEETKPKRKLNCVSAFLAQINEDLRDLVNSI